MHGTKTKQVLNKKIYIFVGGGQLCGLRLRGLPVQILWLAE